MLKKYKNICKTLKIDYKAEIGMNIFLLVSMLVIFAILAYLVSVSVALIMLIFYIIYLYFQHFMFFY